MMKHVSEADSTEYLKTKKKYTKRGEVPSLAPAQNAIEEDDDGKAQIHESGPVVDTNETIGSSRKFKDSPDLSAGTDTSIKVSAAENGDSTEVAKPALREGLGPGALVTSNSKPLQTSPGPTETQSTPEGIEVINPNTVLTDAHSMYPIIYRFIKSLQREWNSHILAADLNEAEKASQLRVCDETAENVKPLLKKLAKRSLDTETLSHLAKILSLCQQAKYRSANNAYLDLSIGNAAWQNGLISVGSHEKSSERKFAKGQKAHILNDEVSRKWIQGIKRLMTFAQKVRPAVSAAENFE